METILPLTPSRAEHEPDPRAAIADVAAYIDTFYNQVRRHGHLAAVRRNSKRLTSRIDGSTKCWELHGDLKIYR